MACFIEFYHTETVSKSGRTILARYGWDCMFSQLISSLLVSPFLFWETSTQSTEYEYQIPLLMLAYIEYCQGGWGTHEFIERWRKKLAGKYLTIYHWTTVID